LYASCGRLDEADIAEDVRMDREGETRGALSRLSILDPDVDDVERGGRIAVELIDEEEVVMMGAEACLWRICVDSGAVEGDFRSGATL
jgi:hypothetical protein